jgi:plasmid maintenance system antidote protein VapI
MNPITRAILLREASATTRMSLGRRVVAGLLGVDERPPNIVLPDLSDLVRRKGECPIHDHEGEEVIAQRNYAVAPGEYVAEWLTEHDTDMDELTFDLGVTESYAKELIAGRIPVSITVAIQLENLTGIPVKQWTALDTLYWKDKERIARESAVEERRVRREQLLGEGTEEEHALLDRLPERVTEALAAAKDGTFKGVTLGDEEPLVHRLADER